MFKPYDVERDSGNNFGYDFKFIDEPTDFVNDIYELSTNFKSYSGKLFLEKFQQS